jgi:hypothetical protein
MRFYMKKKLIVLILLLSLLLCACAKEESPAVVVPDPEPVTVTLIPPKKPVPQDEADTPAPTVNAEPEAPAPEPTEPAPVTIPSEPEEAPKPVVVPIYPIGGDEKMAAVSTPDEEAPAESEAPPTEEPEPEQNSAAAVISPYLTHTMYPLGDGAAQMELSVKTPQTDAEVFNTYYNNLALEYINFASGLLVIDTENAAVPPTRASFDYKVLYNEGGYVCVLVTQSEVYADRTDTRYDAAVFDMENSVLVDSWQPETELDTADAAACVALLSEIPEEPAAPPAPTDVDEPDTLE